MDEDGDSCQRATHEFKEKMMMRASEVLHSYNGYDVLPESCKVVVFENRIPVVEALRGLQENKIKCAAVWDSIDRRFTGAITVTDFVHVLLHMYELNASMSSENFAGQLSSQSISDWARMKADRGTSIPHLISIGPDDTMFHAAKLLSAKRIHRVYVVEPQDNIALGQVTLHNVMSLVHARCSDEPYWNIPVSELGIGTFTDLLTVTPETPLIKALELITTYSISGLPVVNSEGIATDVYSRSDVLFLAEDNTFDISAMTIGDALANHKNDRLVPVCRLEDSLRTAVKLLISTGKHRVTIVDEDNRLIGVVSLSDIMAWLVLSINETPGAIPPTPPPRRGSSSSVGSARSRSSSRASSISRVDSRDDLTPPTSPSQTPARTPIAEPIADNDDISSSSPSSDFSDGDTQADNGG